MGIQLHEGQRLVYQTDEQGFYVGEAVADPDPKNAGNWLIPAGCVETKPPFLVGGRRLQWAGYKWKSIDV